MNKRNKYLFSIIFALLMFFVAATITTGFSSPIRTYADTLSFSVDDYTNEDTLLQSDGSSSLKTIIMFAEEVKAASLNTEFQELSQVIPRQYLETEEKNITFMYNGKEYGFYVAKENETFDILLVDFVYEFAGIHDTDLEYKIRIEPILQQSFLRYKTKDGSYSWKKTENNYRYYILNPRFLTVLQNENDLNYGDSGYSKIGDEGLLISQFRVNYGKVHYATEADLAYTISNFLANKLFDYSCELLDTVTGGIEGKIIGCVKDYIEFGVDIYNVGKETVVLADNENNIKTEKSKTAQMNDNEIASYSRVAAFMPKDEIVLSDASNSYAEFIAVLNDANCRTRLTQICEFDIVRRANNFSSMEHVAGNWLNEDSDSLQFSKERILFDEQSKHVEVFGDEVQNSLPLYLLPNANQIIYFSSEYSGKYCFKTPNNTVIDIVGAAKANEENTFYLENGKNYKIVILNTAARKIISTAKYELASKLNIGRNSVALKAGELFIFKINANIDSCYELHTTNSSVTVYSGAQPLSQGKYSIDVKSNISTYIVLENNSLDNISCDIVIENPQEMLVEVDETFSPGDYLRQFSNIHRVSVKFDILLKGENNKGNTVLVFNDKGTVESSYAVKNGVSTYTFVLSANQKCFIRLSIANSTLIQIKENEEQWRWVIDGKEQIENIVKLKRAETYTIYLGWVGIDKKLVKVESDYLVSFDDPKNCSYTEEKLVIKPDVTVDLKDNNGNSLPTKVFFAPQPLGPSLTIIIEKNDVCTVNLHKNDGSDAFYTVTYEKGQEVDFGEKPENPGYTFNGYFSFYGSVKSGDKWGYRYQYVNHEGHLILVSSSVAPIGIIGGVGSQVFNYDMVLQRSNIDKDLYACWVPNKYSVTFEYNNGTGQSETQYVFYKQNISNPQVVKRRGYRFSHYEDAEGYFYLMENENSPHNVPQNIVYVGQWIIDSPAYLDLVNLGKENGCWKIRIINTVDTKMTITYNKKMCYAGDAQKWQGLVDTEDIVLKPGESVDVLISGNWFATSVAASWVINDVRYITYANELSADGGISKKYDSV